MFSSLDGFSTPEEIAQRILDIGGDSCALTDHGVVTGHLDFSKAMLDKGLKPIFGCLFAGQPIVTSMGVKAVEDIQVGDLVLTHRGRYRPVTRTMSRSYKGLSYNIRPAQSRKTLNLTGEHPVLVRRENTDCVEWIRADELIQSRCYAAGNLVGGDEVCLPKSNHEGPDAIDTLAYLPSYFYRTLGGGIGRDKRKKFDRNIHWRLPANMFLNFKRARMLGLYVAEGSAKVNGEIRFSFNINEVNYARDVVDELELLGVAATLRPRAHKSILEVTACCVPLALLLRELCGVGAHHKRIPREIMEGSQTIQDGFMSGLADGDCKHGQDGSRTLKVASADLAWGFRTLLSNFGHWNNVTSVGDHYAVAWQVGRQYSRTREDTEYLYKRIADIDVVPVDTTVFNFEVQEDHSYVSDFALHNCELYHGLTKKTTFKRGERDQAHLIALAMTNEGLRNLWCLVDATSQLDHFQNVGRVFWDDIEKFNEGVLFTSACAQGLVPQGIIRGDYEAANRYLDILGDNFMIEIGTYPEGYMFGDPEDAFRIDQRMCNEALVAWAQERGVPITYGDDGHYAFPWQWEYHDIYVARQTGESMYTPVDERTMWHPEDALVIKDEYMVRESLSYLHPSVVDEALDNARMIAERADAKLPEVRRHLPMFVPSDCPWLDEPLKKLSAEELFIELVERGIVNRYGANASKEVWQRTLYEVETLLNDGIHHYFLMGWDEIQIAKALGIERGPGRGSSAGCIAAYALDITDVDPLHYGLIFERFWNSGRAKGFPDIDTDFSRARRQEIIAALKERWGEENVAAIGTTGYLKPKATIDKMAKACGIDFKEAEVLKEIVGKTTKIEILGHEQIGWNPKLEPGKKYYVQNDCGDAIEEWCKADKKREDVRRYFIKVCETCCSRVAQYGIHASGIVISDTPINEELPTYRRGGKKGMPATMFSMEDVDNRMFVKLDVLGLRTLDVLEYWRDAMAEKGIEIKWSGLDKEEHPQEMWDMLAQGYTAGIFQVEDGYGKQLCKALNPSSLLDLSAIGALNRPGPIQAKIPDEYIARHNGIHPVTFIHPRFQELMEDALDETYGLFVYQEQIIAYFNRLNYTLGESDAIRKIMGKKKPEQMDGVRDGLDEWEGRGYLDMAVESGIPRDIAGRVWEDLEGFADYCFNKSHTVAYGIIGFRALFAKYYGAAEFYAACIRSLDPSTDAEKRTDMMPQFINECRRQGIAVSPPDIYHSRGYPHVSPEGVLYFGFADIAEVRSSGDYIAELRDSEGLNVESAEAFREDFDIYNEAWGMLKKEKVAAGEWDAKVRSPKQQLQANKLDALENVGAWFGVTGCPITMTARQALEEQYLGVILTDNTAEVFDRNEQEISHLDSYVDLNVPFADKLEEYEIDPDDSKAYIEYTIPGVVVGVQEKRTRKDNKPFGIVTVEFGSDSAEFAVWSNKWRSHKFLFRMRTPGIFTLQHRPKNEYGESYNFVRGTKLT